VNGKVHQPAGNYYDKYNTRNPVARALMQGFLKSFDELVAMSGSPGTALEIGCGEGELSMRLARAGWLVSVPREPIWRMLNMARGRYLSALGNTPGHIQHWSARAFVELVGQRLDVQAVRSPLPWTMALCRVRAP